MSDKTGIGWTDATWNPVTGCTRVSEGCMNCYAEQLSGTKLKSNPKYEGLTRISGGEVKWTGEVRCHESELLKPLSWAKPRRVFVNSMSDTFHEKVPFEFLDRLFAVMALCPQHQFQVLTKRPERAAEYLNRHDWHEGVITKINSYFGPDDPAITAVRAILPNVWLGTSVENQEQADKRIPHLLRCPAAVRFLSVEPLIGDIKFRDEWLGWHPAPMGGDLKYASPLHWVIVGGESGPGRREMRLEWLEGIVRQCQAAGVPVFVKQASGPRPGMQGGIPDRIWNLKQFPGGEA